MKAHLFAVETERGWRAERSIAWEVEPAWWLSGFARRIVRLEAALPLGIAEAAAGAATSELRRARGDADAWRTLAAAAAEALGGQAGAAAAGCCVWTAGKAGPREEAGSLRRVGECLRGRSLLWEEAVGLLAEQLPGFREAEAAALLQLAERQGLVRLQAAVGPARQAFRAERRCRRCGCSGGRLRESHCAGCGRLCAVCEGCIAMGRCRECALLVRGASSPALPLDAAAGSDAALSRWGLSPAQREASAEALRFLRGEHPSGRSRRQGAASRDFLIWAVTGAGKTEMIFPLLDASWRAGGRAAVATPRQDVVRELAPRLARAFPGAEIAVLYGGSADRWKRADFTLATTHQLMRFNEAFDLVIIDELDAYPYHNDPMLHFAAAQSRKTGGGCVLLSATPPAGLRREAAAGRIGCVRVPVRYHRHPLPVPKRLALPALRKWSNGRGAVPARLLRTLRQSAARGAQLFVFVPYIRQVDPLVRRLREHAGSLGLAAREIDGTSSQDERRADKVQRFRDRGIRLLVTTTILERGVTVPRSDVFILDAHLPLFDEAALVQMAGRAGRSADDPDGRVYFGSAYWTIRQQGAIRQIRAMNRLARRKGYLLPRSRRGFA